MIDINKAKDRFGSWQNVMLPFLSTDEFQGIYRKLKEKARKGTRILPDSINTYKAFEVCNYNDLKCIIVGLSPYHTIKGNIPIADGIALSCGNTQALAPSLDQWYRAIEEDIYGGLNLDMVKEPDLTFLAKEGVLLLNASLTVEENRPGGHLHIWEPFMKYFFTEVINKYTRGLPIVFLGKESSKYEKYVQPLLHYTKVVEHPAKSSYEGRNWKHENIFSWVNNILEQNNGKEYTIKWIKEDSIDCPF